MIRRFERGAAAILCLAAAAATAHAQLFDLQLDVPTIVFDNTGVTTYDASSGAWDVTATALAVRLEPMGAPVAIGGARVVSIGITLDSAGNLVGGGPGPDIEVVGDVDVDGDSVTDYSGVLLTGEIAEFEFRDNPGTADEANYLFTGTGGAMVGFYGGRQIGVTQLIENSTFAGSFAEDFTGGAKGNIAPSGCLCVLVIDEDTIDEDVSSIEDIAAFHDVEAKWLVNEDRPTEIGNPCLRWCEYFPGDVVVLPAKEVDDEGLFALPPDLPWSLEDFVAGVIPQDQLDKIDDVMPLRNQELYRLIGRTCAAVVYDSDISINFDPLLGNLQGERLGLFYFTLLDVIVPSTLPETTSSTALYELLIRVESCELENACVEGVEVEIHEHPPDAVEIPLARYCGTTLKIVAESDFGGSSYTTVSIDGFIFEEPMTYVGGKTFEFVLDTAEDLAGRRVTVQTDHGGAYWTVIGDCASLSGRKRPTMPGTSRRTGRSGPDS
jgi:hypothetical protein